MPPAAVPTTGPTLPLGDEHAGGWLIWTDAAPAVDVYRHQRLAFIIAVRSLKPLDAYETEPGCTWAAPDKPSQAGQQSLCIDILRQSPSALLGAGMGPATRSPDPFHTNPLRTWAGPEKLL